MNSSLDPQLIIIEGPDQCGKTTLGLHLAKQFRGFYYHATCTKALVGAMVDYHRNILDNAETNIKNGVTVILDRYWLSEQVYSRVLRPEIGPYGNDAASYDEMVNRCSKLNAVTICCLSGGAHSRHSLFRDHTHPYTDDQFGAIYREYAGMFTMLMGTRKDMLLYDLETYGEHMEIFGKMVRILYNELIASKSGMGATAT
jgi:hypothetical protein